MDFSAGVSIHSAQQTSRLRLIESCAHNPALVAAAFEVQVVDELPTTATDRRVDLVVTERTLYGGEGQHL